MRVRRGTASLKGGRVLIRSSSNKGARKIRCPKCSHLCAPTMNNVGKPVYKCMCGRTFSLQTM